MKNHNYPIILGHQYRKGVIISRFPDKGGLSLMICRLNRECETGEEFGFADVQNIEQEIWFADEQTVETVIKALQTVLERGKADA